MKQIFILLLSALSVQLYSQNPNSSELSIDQIMQGDGFVGYLPDDIEWSDDSQSIYFSWNPDNDTIRSTYAVDIASKSIKKLTIEDLKNQTEDGNFSSDYKWKTFEKHGDLYVMNTSDFTVQSITKTIERESSPIFSKDGKHIVYLKDNNLFKWNKDSGTTIQLTDFREGKEKKEDKVSEQDVWLERDQLQFFDVLTKRKNQSIARKNRNEKLEVDRPKTIYLDGQSIFNIQISPSLNYVFYKTYKSQNSKSTIVPDFVTESGYTTDLNTRPKVGGPQFKSEAWLLDLATDSTYQIKTDELEGIKDKPNYLKEYASDQSDYSETFEEARDVNIGAPVYAEDGEKAIINITSLDYKDRWIMLLNLKDGSLKQLDRQHDDAWIGGPGVGWFSQGVIGWIDNSTVWFKSEKTGFAHLYTVDIHTGKVKALTSGEFEIQDVSLSKDKSTFYIISNKVSPHQKHFYHLDASGGNMIQITNREGGYEVVVSPDEKQLALRYSYSNKPWELFLMPNSKNSKMAQLTESTTEEFEAYNWRDPKIIQFKARDGVMVPATLYEPEPNKKNGAAVIFVHGAGYTQNVHKWWPSYNKEYMFHNILADNGYTVLEIDFRASAGYGRDWRTAIYRHMGGKDLDDQIDGANYLIEEHGIDKDRLGIYGGSYGGFITLMAMFKYPDTFQSGAALRSVTDWAHYNHGYTANILNTPVSDSLAYVRSSPIYYAEGLKGHLLMLHGMVDRNVHFQDVVRLSQKLIELKKEHWELAVFPVEDHSFVEPSSWSDEYRRIFKLFNATLLNDD